MSQAGRYMGPGEFIETLTGDIGGPVSPDGAGNIDIVGGDHIVTIGSPGTNTITIHLDDDIAEIYQTDSGNAEPASGILQVLGGVGISTSGVADTITIDLDSPVDVINGGTGVVSLTDHGVLLGSGTADVTVTAVGTNGQVLIGATGADPAFATITSTGATITFTPGANSLNMESGGSVPIQFDTDSGSAVPALGILQVLGGANMNTTGATNVVTVILNDFIDLPVTNASFTSGALLLASDRFLHAYGLRNVFLGLLAGNGTLTAEDNTGIGWSALTALTSGTNNTAVGRGSMISATSGSDNVAVGDETLDELTDGEDNTAIGSGAGNRITSSDGNVFLGSSSGRNLQNGSYNTFLGHETAFDLSGLAYSSDYNIIIGYFSGVYNNSASNNILINASGTLAGEDDVIRIGTGTAQTSPQTSCFIAGIAGVTVSNTALVTIDTTTGQLGSTSIAVSGYTNVTTSPYAVLSTDYYLSIDTSALSITVQLPNAPTTGRIYNIKDRIGDAATRNITVTTVGGVVTIDGATTFVMNTAYEAINVIFNGTSYEVF